MGNLTVKENGEMVNIISPNVNNITSFKVHFSPKQEGEGDPSPDNVREIVGWNGVEGYKCGKNMAHIFGYGTQNIIDTDVNRYKTTNTYGTTINTTIFNNPDTPLIIEQSQAPNSTLPSSYQNGYIAIGTDNLVFGQKYNVSFKVSNITNNILNISLNNIRLLVSNGTITNVTEIIDDVLIFKNITFYQNITTPKRQGFEIRICGLSFTLSEFMVTAVDNEDFTYEPYQDNSININWSRNIKEWAYTDLPLNEYSQDIFNGYGNSRWEPAITDIPPEWFGKQLVYSVFIERASSPYSIYDDAKIWFYAEDGSVISVKDAPTKYRLYDPSESLRSWVTFTIPDGTIKIGLGLCLSKGSRAYNPQLEYGEEPTEYQPYVGDIYGGYVDLVSGEIYKGFEQIIFDGNTKFTGITKYEDKIRFMYNKALLTLPIKNGGMCYFNYYTNIETSKFINNGFIGSTGNILIYTDTSIDSIDLLTEYQTNNPLQSVYELETPVYIATLTPQQLSTLKGQNNFWSNADYIEIEYELTETFDIQKAKRKIILSQPHVETASGDLVTFDTDMKGKLKECKVYFSPVQEGEGDPSPDNVRNIVGWNGVEGYSCGKNLFDLLKTTNGKRLNQYGELLANYQNVVSDYIKIQSSGTYTISNSGGLSFNERHCWYDKDKNFLKASDPNKAEIYTLTAPSDAEYIRLTVKKDCLDTAQFESGSEATSYESYQSNTISVDWTDSAGTVYGGYVDLVSGELVQEYWGFTADGENVKANSQYKNENLDIFGAGIVYNNPIGIGANNWREITNVYCNKIPVYARMDYINNIPSLYVPTAGALYMVFYVGKISEHPEITTKADTLEFVNNWLEENPLQLVYQLKNPIHYQLTPQQILTLKGTNNIYSNTNGQTEIKYWKH